MIQRVAEVYDGPLIGQFINVDMTWRYVNINDLVYKRYDLDDNTSILLQEPKEIHSERYY